MRIIVQKPGPLGKGRQPNLALFRAWAHSFII